MSGSVLSSPLKSRGNLHAELCASVLYLRQMERRIRLKSRGFPTHCCPFYLPLPVQDREIFILVMVLLVEETNANARHLFFMQHFGYQMTLWLVLHNA